MWISNVDILTPTLGRELLQRKVRQWRVRERWASYARRYSWLLLAAALAGGCWHRRVLRQHEATQPQLHGRRGAKPRPHFAGRLDRAPNAPKGHFGSFERRRQYPQARLPPSTWRGTCRPGLHGPRCARLTSILGLSGAVEHTGGESHVCLLYTSPSPRD